MKRQRTGAPGPTPGELRAGRPLWRRSLGYGLLWASAITAGEALSVPLNHLSPLTRLLAMLYVFGSWIPAGIGIAWFAFASERRRMSMGMVVPLLLVLAVAHAALQSAAWIGIRYFELPNPLKDGINTELPSWANISYVLWMTLVHGAMFVAGCRLGMRVEHTRHLMGAAQIARGRGDALLAAAQLDTLRARIDPAFLLQAMSEIQQRYDRDVAGADQLLDELVGFLRLAMPGVRSGTSTLAAELRLAQAYAALNAQIQPLQGRWVFLLDEVAPDLAFPPLLLLPVLDTLTPARADAGESSLTLRGTSGRLRLSIHGAGSASLPPALIYRIQVALQTLFGTACTLVIGHPDQPGAPTLTVHLALARTAPQARQAPLQPRPAPPDFFQRELHHA